jgi:hypothetical protein
VLLVRLTLFILSAALSLIVAEGISRVVAPRALSYPWMDTVDGITVPLANVHGRHFVPGTYDTNFSFNAQRFRGAQLLAQAASPGTIRIAVLGSSFTFGSGANDDETYPFQLQRILEREAQGQGSHAVFEVINAGMPGSVVADEALWYDTWVQRFRPQLVILNVACVVDFPTTTFAIDHEGKPVLHAGERRHPSRNGSVRRVLRQLPGYVFLSQHSEFFNLLALKVGQAIRRGPSIEAQNLDSRSSDDGVNELQRSLSMEVGEIGWLNEDVRRSGARLALVVLPCHENVDSSATPDADEIRREYAALSSQLRSFAAKEKVPFLDLAPTLRSTAEASEPFFYAGRFETHPTPAGYRAIANGVARFLFDNDLLPAHVGPS